MKDTTQQQFEAHWNFLLTLVKTLHEEGALPVQALVNRLGERLDADATLFREPTNPFSKVMYDGLLQLEPSFRDPKGSGDSAAPSPPDKG